MTGIKRNPEKRALRVHIVPGIERNPEKRSLRGGHRARNSDKSQKAVTLKD